MKLTVIPGILVVVASCGGPRGANIGGDNLPPPEEPKGSPIEALYDRCGLYTTKDMAEEGLVDKSEEELTDEDLAKLSNDPAGQTPADVDACMEFIRLVYDDRTDLNQMVGANDVSYALCFGETANGEACYFKALSFQIPVWNGEGDEFSADSVVQWLSDGCNLGYAPACAIVQSGVDDQGREWAVGYPTLD